MFCTCNHDIWQTSFRLGPIHFRWLSAWSERAREPDQQPLTNSPRFHPNNLSNQHIVTMSAAWKSAGLTYVALTALAHPMRADHSEN
jgi:hypothetical protein